MDNSRFITLYVVVSLFLHGLSWAQGDAGASTTKQDNDPVNAVVKLEVSTARSDILCPWVNVTDGSAGSGVVVGSGRILTCAHCVVDAAYIRVRKQNEDMLYHATVLFVDNDADLALVQVEDPNFMVDISPLEIGETPHVQEDVMAVGYPVGGNDISYTRGIVSRIEDIRYAHAWSMLLGIQVDAAINRGNSGGPVLDMKNGKIAGIVFQSKEKGEALGYVIPPDIIRHFLIDIQDGRVDGFAACLFAWDQMESSSKRRYYMMKPGMTGVCVDDVNPALGNESIRTGDVILEIDGYKVSNNGRIRLDGREARSLYYPIYIRQVGEKVPVKVLRKGVVTETFIVAAKINHRIRGWMYDSKPDFFLYGGFVFTTVSYDYMVETEAKFYDRLFSGKQFQDDEPVVISFVFADEGIEGYIGFDKSLVRSVNGIKVRNLRHLVELADTCCDGFVRFGLDRGLAWDFNIVVDAKEMRETTARVMKRNQIPEDRSEDLRTALKRKTFANQEGGEL
ncbi:MAG: trypsin-like peptidase domain-containing protein [Kiritimatiellae bacterium]|nr:trypsin-like peptidase domain-containing protein [Kiritimatiellia bacterium]